VIRVSTDEHRLIGFVPGRDGSISLIVPTFFSMHPV
jgi:hypothetical protein